MCFLSRRTFFPAQWTDLPSVSARLCEICDEHRGQAGGSLVVGHAFSNGGCLTLLSMLQRQVHFDGVIYDSAPSKRLHPIYSPFVIASSGADRWTMAKLIARHAPYALAASAAVPFVGDVGPLGEHAKLRCTDANPPRPELFLYSSGDRLIGDGDVRDFIECRRALGSAVTDRHLDASEHVAHFRTHPQEYSEAVETFVCGLPRDSIESNGDICR